MIGGAPLVLADGHHRFETALQLPRRAAGRGRATLGGAAAIMTFVVELVDERAVHRADPPPGRRRRAGIDVRARSPTPSTCATRARTPPTASTRSTTRCAASAGSGSSTRAGSRSRCPGRRRRAPRRSPASTRRVAATDAAVIEALVVPTARRRDVAVPPRRAARSPPWSTRAPRPRPCSAHRSRWRGPGPPPSTGVRMPQKTTFFSPKPRTGMVFRSSGLNG